MTIGFITILLNITTWRIENGYNGKAQDTNGRRVEAETS
jgi:hypothetical protein